MGPKGVLDIGWSEPRFEVLDPCFELGFELGFASNTLLGNWMEICSWVWIGKKFREWLVKVMND